MTQQDRIVEFEDTGLRFITGCDLERMEALVAEWLTLIGEDPGREGLERTPHRVAETWAFLTRGYREDLAALVNGAIFHVEQDTMVVVKGIEFYSLCEHHLLPFFGHVHIGYLPRGKILGLSKFARVVDLFARRLQVQERLTQQIAHAIQDILDPHGVAVVADGLHLCMMMRGVEKQHARTTTSAMLGVFATSPTARDEFYRLLATTG
ncbi:MAG: GTP cyclohydrolase I FolE [Thermomicrobium sp.]|nr:GTP cyclohydrolase I FolE [Thermomicrobium sp.]MDW8058610.1 GTP cyclohydrolase I FolE [Thermomicrobium sp.]